MDKLSGVSAALLEMALDLHKAGHLSDEQLECFKHPN